ncbi:MAG: hypothetical protein HY098_08995 [Nitrospinae bacterium]|nr:hypothetical protein [Nitrospinota bacterium]
MAVFKRIVLAAVVLISSQAFAGGPPIRQDVEYTGDMVMIADGRQMASSRVFHAPNKQRTEMMGNVTIARMDKKVTWVLIHDSKRYMETPMDPRRVPPTELPDASFTQAGTETIKRVRHHEIPL